MLPVRFNPHRELFFFGGGETQCTVRQRACVATLLRALPTSRKRLRELPQTPKQMPRDLRGAPQTSKLKIWSLRGAPQTSKLRIWDLRGAPQTSKLRIWDLRVPRKHQNSEFGACGAPRKRQNSEFGACGAPRKRVSNSYRQNTTRTNPTLGARPCLIIYTGEGGDVPPLAPVLLILFPQEDL